MYLIILIIIFLLPLQLAKAEKISETGNNLMAEDNQKKELIINLVILQGNTVFSQSELEEITKPFIHQDLSVTNLQQIVIKVRQFYREKGYVNADVYANSEQNFAQGIVKIKVIEGILEKVEINGLTTLSKNYVLARLPSSNRPLNIKQLEKALLLLKQNQLLFKDITSKLTRGTLPSSSILIINIVENERFALNLEANNYGAFNSGENQLETSLAINNLVGYGDRFKTEFIISDGSEQILVDYSFPLSPQYGEIRFHYDYGSSEIITPPLNKFEIRGIYQQGFVEWRFPVKEEVTEKWFVSLKGGVENSRNFVLDEPFSFIPQVPDSGYTIYNFRLTSDYLKSFTTSAIANRAEITVGWDSLSQRNEPVAIFRFQSNYINQIDERILLSATVATQLSASSLVGGSPIGVLPSEQFPLGGIETVPGYDLYLRRGDNGFNAIAQVYATLWEDADLGKMQLIPFFAYGKVWNETLEILPPRNLASTGIEWTWNVKNWEIKLGAAFPLVEVDADFERPLYFSIKKKISF